MVAVMLIEPVAATSGALLWATLRISRGGTMLDEMAPQSIPTGGGSPLSECAVSHLSKSTEELSVHV